MSYRIYANIQGWERIDVSSSLNEVIKVLDGLVADNVCEFIVVESSKEKGDFPIITTMGSYFDIKEKLKNNKVKKLGVKP